MENLSYKHNDYLIRSGDYYALTKYQIVMKLLPDKENLNVLNAGCGSGEMNQLLAENRTWKITAIDIDDKSISLSQDLKREFSIDNLTLIKTSIEKHVTSEKYDIIVSNDVLEHIEDDVAAVKKLMELLKDDGLLCVSVPALSFLYGHHDEMLGHYRRYNKRSLKKILEFGFIIEKCRYFGGILLPVALYYSKIARKAYPVNGVNKNSVVKAILLKILNIERSLSLPLGTSLIALGRLNNEK